MNAKQLRALLADAPDDAVILVPTSDHGLREVSVVLTTALREGRATYTEDHGERVTPEADYGKRVPALVVGA